jgi:lysophospholipase L1-like esterase
MPHTGDPRAKEKTVVKAVCCVLSRYSMLRFFPALLFALTVSVSADPITIWPMPPMSAPGVPVPCFPTPRPDWLGTFNDHLTQARSVPVDLVFDGDCITDSWNRNAGKVWKERYAPLNGFNFAQVWDGIQHILWRVENGELDGLHPKLIVLTISTHDNGPNSPADIVAGLTAVVSAYREHSPTSHILIIGMLPSAASPTDPVRAKVAEINRGLAKLDDGKNITFLDIGPKFLQSDGTLPGEVMPDDATITEKGHQVWADAIQPIIDQYCPKSAVTSAANFQPPTGIKPAVPVTFPLPPRPAGTSITTFPVPDVGWYQRFQTNLDKLKNGPYDLIFEGDSITDNWQGPGADEWKKRYGSIKAADLAIGGDTSQFLIWRVQHGSMEGQNPKLIVLLIGTNNGGNPDELAAGIKLLVHEYETRCPDAHILLQGVFPRDHDANTGTRNWVKQINANLAKFVSDPRITYIDFGDRFLQPDGTLSADIMPDFLHPSPAGYVIWADAIQPIIDQYFPKAPAK